MPWNDLTDTDLAAGKPLKQSVMRAFRDNDITNSDKPVHLEIDEGESAGTSYGSSVGTYYVYVPEDGRNLRIPGALWAAAGTGYCKAVWQLDQSPTGTQSYEVSGTATSKGSPGGSAAVELVLSGLHQISGVDDARGQVVQIDFYFKNSVNSTQTDFENTDWYPPRFSYEY